MQSSDYEKCSIKFYSFNLTGSPTPDATLLPASLVSDLTLCSNLELAASFIFFFQFVVGLVILLSVCFCGCCENGKCKLRLFAPIDLGKYLPRLFFKPKLCIAAMTRPSRFLSICIVVLLAHALLIFVNGILAGKPLSATEQIQNTFFVCYSCCCACF